MLFAVEGCDDVGRAGAKGRCKDEGGMQASVGREPSGRQACDHGWKGWTQGESTVSEAIDGDGDCGQAGDVTW